jgi:DNA (cytosine-5)-methyltransferase 1
LQALAVRRLTPLETLRLQGLPDDWLDGLGLADSVKYRMVGNAVAVPCVEWIARRMIKIDEQP